jgi:hypothetical protein
MDSIKKYKYYKVKHRFEAPENRRLRHLLAALAGEAADEQEVVVVHGKKIEEIFGKLKKYYYISQVEQNAMEGKAAALVRSLLSQLEAAGVYDMSRHELEFDYSKEAVIIKPLRGGWRPYQFVHSAVELVEWLYLKDAMLFKETVGVDTLEAGRLAVRSNSVVANQVWKQWLYHLGATGVLESIFYQKMVGEYFVYDQGAKKQTKKRKGHEKTNQGSKNH